MGTGESGQARTERRTRRSAAGRPSSPVPAPDRRRAHRCSAAWRPDRRRRAASSSPPPGSSASGSSATLDLISLSRSVSSKNVNARRVLSDSLVVLRVAWLSFCVSLPLLQLQEFVASAAARYYISKRPERSRASKEAFSSAQRVQARTQNSFQMVGTDDGRARDGSEPAGRVPFRRALWSAEEGTGALKGGKTRRRHRESESETWRKEVGFGEPSKSLSLSLSVALAPWRRKKKRNWGHGVCVCLFLAYVHDSCRFP